MYLISTVSSVQPAVNGISARKRVMAKQSPPGIFLSVSERVTIIIVDVVVIRVSLVGRKKCGGRSNEAPLLPRPKADAIVTSFTDVTGTESVPIFRVLLVVW